MNTTTTESTVGKLVLRTLTALELHEQSQAVLLDSVAVVRDGLASAAGLLDEWTREHAEMFETFPDAVEWALLDGKAERLLEHAEAALVIFEENEGWSDGRTSKALRQFVRDQLGLRELERNAGKRDAA